VILLLSIGLTAFAAFDAQRAVRSQHSIAVRALREYASFAAWSYAQHVSLRLDEVGREVLGAVNHGDAMHMSPQIPPASHLSGYIRWDTACNCHRTLAGPSPDAFFALDLRSGDVNDDFNAAVTNGAPTNFYRSTNQPSSADAIAVASPPFRQWITDSLATRDRTHADLKRGFGFVVAMRPTDPRIVSYTLMPTAWGDTIVYGAVYSHAAFTRILAAALDSPDLLPQSFSEGLPKRAVIDVDVTDRAGQRIFGTATQPTPGMSARIATPFVTDSLTVEAAVRPEVASTLLIGGLTPSAISFPLGLLALAAALSVIAVVQIRREGELARLRSGFVSSVSHELRTPVAQIRLYLDTLRLGRAKTSAQREWALGHIERETRRLSYLVENVLRFSTLESQQPSVPELVDPAAAMREIIDEFEPLARARGAAIELDAAATGLVAIRKDALRHILVNLLDNAVKYGPSEQTIRITVRTDTHGRVVIAVQDEGPGISHAEREAIWRPFARGSAGATTGGSGIGLTIVRELARANGGSAFVDQAVPAGTRFVVELPPADPVATQH